MTINRIQLVYTLHTIYIQFVYNIFCIQFITPFPLSEKRHLYEHMCVSEEVFSVVYLNATEGSECCGGLCLLG